MIKLKKRIFALLLALSVLFSAAVTLADDPEDDDEFFDDGFDDEEATFEEDEQTVDFRTIAGYDTGEKYVSGDFVYQLTEDSQGAVIVSYTGTAPDVVVPDTLDGHPVVAIGAHMCAYSEVVETVQLPAGIMSIGNMAFFKCVRLRGIVIPDGVKLIDECCFGGCDALAEVVFPSSLEEVGRFSFLACVNLKEVDFGPRLKAIGPGAFQMCSSLNRVTIPGGEAVSIEPDSFSGCAPDLEIISR